MTAQREFLDGELVSGTRYRVVSLIGAGGMGSVYEVEHQELGKRFVLKALLRHLASREDLAQRLRNEWRALGRLEHPSIVNVTDAGVTDTGVPFYVMERLKGETLASRLRRERRLPLADAVRIAADVLDGLSAAHRIGIVHRDVKPPNIFLVAGKRATLLDFGIAKMLDSQASQITGRGMAVGTPRYMAPEQATGGVVDARTDLYAVGLILFEAAAGSGPFDSARDANELFLAHLTREPPALSSAVPRVPAVLDRLVQSLLAKTGPERPADAATVAHTLRSLLGQLTAAAPPPVAPLPAGNGGDPTSPGGPWDTLATAKTTPSGAPGHGPAALASEQPTRTGLGPHEKHTTRSAPPSLSLAEVPDTLAGAPPPDTTGASPRTATLRLPTFEGYPLEPEVETHTAVPSVAPETPPPVEHSPSPSLPGPARSSRRRWLWMAGVPVAAAGMGLAFVARAPHADGVPSSSPGVEPPAESRGAEAAERPPAVGAASTRAEPVRAAPAPSVAFDRAAEPAVVPSAPQPTVAAAPPVPARVPARPANARMPSKRAVLPDDGLEPAVPREAASAPQPATAPAASPKVRVSKEKSTDVLPSSGL
jgi:serine/threonine protein kinase